MGDGQDRAVVPKETRIWKLREAWWFTDEFLLSETPSRLDGMSYEEEAHHSHQLCQLIQTIGQLIEVSQLCINTACIYMRRFFTQRSMVPLNRNQPLLQVVAATCLFLAGKVEEKPRKLEHIIQWKLRLCGSHLSQSRAVSGSEKENAEVSLSMDTYKFFEEEIIKVLGFDLTIDHPHTHVVKACQLFSATADFAQTAYFMATNSIHLTNLCLQYSPATIAGSCIWIAFKWSRMMFPSRDGIPWFQFVDRTLTLERLEHIGMFLMNNFEKHPLTIQRIMNPQKYRDDVAKRRFRLEGFLIYNKDENSSSQGSPVPSTPRTGSSGSSRQGSSRGPIQPGSSQSSSHLPSGSSSSSCVAAATAATSSVRPESRHQDPSRSQKSESSVRGYSNQAVITEGGPVVVTTTSVSVNASGTIIASGVPHTTPTTVHHPSMATTVKGHHSQGSGTRPEQHGMKRSASSSQVLNPPPTKKLSLQDYHQRVEQRPPPPVQQPQKVDTFAPLHPENSSGPHSHPAHTPQQVKPHHHSSSSSTSSSRHQHPPPSPQVKKVSGPPPHPVSREGVPSHHHHVQVSDRSQHAKAQRGHVHELAPQQVQLKAEPSSPNVGVKLSHTPQEASSPVVVKKESGGQGTPGSASRTHLCPKEAKVVVQDLKDSQGQDRAMYTHAEASRRRSTSQSFSEDLTPEDADYQASRQALVQAKYDSQARHARMMEEKAQETPSSAAARHNKELQSKRSGSGSGSKHKSPRTDTPSAAAVPLKLVFKMEQGQVHIQTHDTSPAPATTPAHASTTPSKSSPLKMKVRVTPSQAHVVETDSQGLRVRLPVGTSSGSSRGHERHPGRSSEGQERRHRHGSSQERSSHRGSLPSLPLPLSSGDGSGSNAGARGQKSQSRLSLPTHNSGFTFTDSLISSHCPENIFEPEAPSDANGGLDSKDGMSQLNAHLLYGQTLYLPPPPPSFLPHHLMNTIPHQPPLPPPLPDNPPPPPPPPPQ